MANSEPQSPSARDGTQVLRRAIDVLRAVARIQRSGASLAAITRATGLSRSTAFRIVHFLTDERLLDYDERQGSYHIGPLAYELGLAARGQGALVESWQPRLEAISKATGMTAYLVARSDSEIVCLATAEAASILRAVSLIAGQRLPLGVGAGSLAILSSLDDDEVEALLASNKDKFRQFGEGRLSADKLWKRIALTRAQGYAFSEDSVAKGVRGIGIAISGPGRLPQLAVSVSAPVSEFEPGRVDEIIELIRPHRADNPIDVSYCGHLSAFTLSI